MTTPDYLNWPFWPDRPRSDEQERQWWRDCYVRGAADRQLEGLFHWFVLAGPPGSGKSVALEAWKREEARDALVLDYPPSLWPGASTAWRPNDPSHIMQMLAVAADKIAQTIHAHPELAAGLDPFQREFLRALLERQGGQRAYVNFVRALPPDAQEGYLSVPTDGDYFSDSHTRSGLQALIQELALLVGALGYRRVVYVVDPDPKQPLGPAHLRQLGDLFGWLDLTDSPYLAVVAALRDDLLRDSDVLARARARVNLVYTDWTAAECHEVAARHARRALPDAPTDFSIYSLMTAESVTLADQLVHEECGEPNPLAWVWLADSALYAMHHAEKRLVAPIVAEEFPTLRWLYFARHVKLRLDAAVQGVWRNSRLLTVENQPWRFLELLSQHDGPVNWWNSAALQRLARTQNNVHSIASRTRKAIEPDPDNPVYLLSRRGEDGGYWLECRKESNPAPIVAGL